MGLEAMASMVETFLTPTLLTWVWHERTATPSSWTVQAPHRPTPQPNLVPVFSSTSRSTHSKGVSASTSTTWSAPLTFSV